MTGPESEEEVELALEEELASLRTLGIEPVRDSEEAGELAPEFYNDEVEAPSEELEEEEPLEIVEEELSEDDMYELLRGASYEAPNVAAAKKTVVANRIFQLLGTLGDESHQEGSGDHTRRSTHRGKLGYPTQGVVHAIDIGGSNALLASIEAWIRREWRAGRLTGLKYINVLNRHWNVQNWTNYYQAKAGTLRPTHSDDHHLHISFENGLIDGNIISRYLAYRTGTTTSEDDMPTPADLWNYKIGSPSLYYGTKAAGDLLKSAFEANQKIRLMREELADLRAAVARIEALLISMQP